MISITIRNLSKRFGETLALDSIDLDIEPGEIFFLLGPSGCGKTTLLRTIAGFYTPDKGTILFGKEDVTNLPPHKRNTGMMFQSYALWPHMTVARNVAFGLEERKVPRQETARRVREALAAVQMERFGERKINQLSGGQQQRVALARALVIRPRCLLLDEPLSNLDAKLRLEMRGQIRSVCKEAGLTAVYVTHDQKEALSISDRLAVLNAGRIEQVGTPGEVYRSPCSRFVADFIGETNFLQGTVKSAREDRIKVETADGLFTGHLPKHQNPPQNGAKVTLSIRPEAISLGGSANGANAFRGKLGESIYLGEVAQYRLLTPERAIKIFEMNPRLTELERDVEMTASVAAEDVVVLTR